MWHRWRRIRTIVRKDWEDVLRHKLVLLTLVLTPLLFVVIGLGTVSTTHRAVQASPLDPSKAEEIRRAAGDLCAGLADGECVAVYLAVVFMLMFMLLPVLLPTVFAAHSIVGEKNGRTLEPILGTPITTTELLLGKMIAAVVPGVGVTWLGVVAYGVGLMWLSTPQVLRAVVAPKWLAAVILLGPLSAVLGVNFAIVVSSRVSDPRVAQQVAGLLVMPAILVLVGQSLGWIIVDGRLVGVAIAAVAVLDVASTWVAVGLFGREQVLTRWK